MKQAKVMDQRKWLNALPSELVFHVLRSLIAEAQLMQFVASRRKVPLQALGGVDSGTLIADAHALALQSSGAAQKLRILLEQGARRELAWVRQLQLREL